MRECFAFSLTRARLIQLDVLISAQAALVELFVDGSSANRHFHNLAKWQGRQYHSKSLANPIPTGQLAELVAGAIAKPDLSKAY